MIAPLPYDLIVLAADADAEQSLRAVLARHQALGIDQIRFDIFRDSRHDPGCRIGAATFLRQFLGKAHHAIVVFDHEGCGADETSPVDLEQRIEDEIERNGWDRSRIGVVIIAPELENWVWGTMPQLERVCNWTGRIQRLSAWLDECGILPVGQQKPTRPKEALQRVLRETRTPFSPALFRRLAERVSLQSCQDRAFNKSTSLLRAWFTPPQ
jgi:hypothetical protein